MIYINGDSYSAPDENFKVWAEHLSDITKKNVTNHSTPGSNNDRIFRSSIEYLNNNNCKIVILATSFLTREEFWDNTWGFKGYIHKDELAIGSKFITSTFYEDKYDLFRSRKLFDLHKPVVDYYQNCYYFSMYCRSKDIKYFIFPAAQNLLDGEFWDPDFLVYLKKLTIYKEVVEDENIWDINSFSQKDWAEKNNLTITDSSHLTDTESHKMFAEHLYNERIKYII